MVSLLTGTFGKTLKSQTYMALQKWPVFFLFNLLWILSLLQESLCSVKLFQELSFFALFSLDVSS